MNTITIILNTVILTLVTIVHLQSKRILNRIHELRSLNKEQALQIQCAKEVMKKHIGLGWEMFFNNAVDLEKARLEDIAWRKEREAFKW